MIYDHTEFWCNVTFEHVTLPPCAHVPCVGTVYLDPAAHSFKIENMSADGVVPLTGGSVLDSTGKGITIDTVENALVAPTTGPYIISVNVALDPDPADPVTLLQVQYKRPGDADFTTFMTVGQSALNTFRLQDSKISPSIPEGTLLRLNVDNSGGAALTTLTNIDWTVRRYL